MIKRCQNAQEKLHRKHVGENHYIQARTKKTSPQTKQIQIKITDTVFDLNTNDMER